MTKLFEQDNYFVETIPPAREGVPSDLYGVFNSVTGVLERKEPGLGYAILWAKHLDYVYKKALISDPDKDAEESLMAMRGQRSTSEKLPLPELPKV